MINLYNVLRLVVQLAITSKGIKADYSTYSDVCDQLCG